MKPASLTAIALAAISIAAAMAQPADRAIVGLAPTVENCGPGATLDAKATHHTGTATIGGGSPAHCTIKFNPGAFPKTPPCFARWRVQSPPLPGGAPIVDLTKDRMIVEIQPGRLAFTYFCSAI